MIEKKKKSVFIRFNMDDENDRELYSRLTREAGNSASLTLYVKRALEEYFTLNLKMADRQEFYNQMISVVREEMQSQGMKLVGALLAGIGAARISVQEPDIEPKETVLPDACEKLPDELSSVLDFIR